MSNHRATQPAASTFSTTVDRGGLVRLIRLNGTNRFTGSLDVRSDAGEGRLWFHDGRIVHAESNGSIGEEALSRILRWRTAACLLHASVPAPRVTIERDLALLLEAAAAEPTPRAPFSPPPRAVARPDARQPLLLLGVAAVGILLLITVAAVAFTRRPAPAPAGPPQIVLRVGGAKAIAEELAPALAEGYLASLHLEGVRVTREDTYRSLAQGTRDGAPWAIAVRGMNTPQAFDDLAAGALDVAMTGRRIKPEWQDKVAGLGKLSAPGAEHVVGISGVAVIVHMGNAVPRLDASQLAAIFGGKVADWSGVGRPAEGGAAARPIRVYATSDDMGLTDLFRTLVLGNVPYAADATRVTSLQQMNDAVAADPDGIGFVTLPFVRGTRAVPIAEADDPPLLPTAFTVATEDYLLTHRLYFYAPPASANPHVLKFLQFVLGPEGQAIVRRSGYVELSVAAERREARTRAAPEYLRLTGGHRRLTSTFRFEVRSSDFDARALVDLERVTRYLVDGRVDGAAVRILGFTDSVGDPARNRELSRARAALVAAAFAQRGITGASVHGLGSEMPVASNATEDGRRRNRRVEVWVAE